MPLIHLTKGDVGDVIHVRLKNADGTAIPSIPDTATCAWRMKRRGDGHTITGAAVITGTDDDEATYTTVAGDADKPGCYDARFVVTYASGAVRSFPSSCPQPDALVVEVCEGA